MQGYASKTVLYSESELDTADSKSGMHTRKALRWEGTRLHTYLSVRCWTKSKRSRKELKSKVVKTSAPEEERGYRETQASRLRHTESPGCSQRVSGTEGQQQPGPLRPRGCIRDLGF